ncbi:PREDICTED: aspartate and serine-rich protein-like [Cyphomyrmex costatus]|uniref:aspartate and serine-rich protein-like n=1 Tax=Cyphomyrmex costatus TaxID=456900 RepID=UPI0008523671|nr:PREDICTED: aspartate and serine-rich protein-like [Cyphomyrmex costatus]
MLYTVAPSFSDASDSEEEIPLVGSAAPYFPVGEDEYSGAEGEGIDSGSEDEFALMNVSSNGESDSSDSDLEVEEKLDSDSEAMDTDPEDMDTDPEGMDTDPEDMDTDTEGMDTDPEDMDTDPEDMDEELSDNPVPSMCNSSSAEDGSLLGD